jgi:2,3-dihydroxy-p-cumate/2,3-dihydroxybenzoate 3,4-dioxygenase
VIELEDIAHVRSGAADLYEHSFGVRRIEDDAAWRPRTFDPAEPGSIDMCRGPTSRPTTRPQLREDASPGDPAPVPAVLPASLSG